MPQSHYRTDWLCIATSGQAVDGRTIEPQWLIDAAETYTRKTYTAMIWPHHPQYDIGEREFTCNLGEVDALKVETEGDVTKLYAQLIPNQFLIDANRMGQKLFTSAEFVTDFAGSGREYLFGLAVTDIPASLGTEKLKFVLAGEEKDAERGSLETFSLGKLQTSKPDKKDSFWSRLFSASKDFTPTPEPNTDKPSEGDGEKMEELKALIQQLLDLVKSGKDAAAGDADTVNTPEQAADEVAVIADEIADAAAEVADLAEEVAGNPEDEVKAEEFSVAKANLAKAMKKFSAAPARRQRTRNRRREFSAGRQAGNPLNDLSEQLTTVMTKLSAMESNGTRRPGNAPAGDKKPRELV
ncbi:MULTISPECIES: GPO family capsid scaffolding protein [Citrobacter]|uniref:GPO family capsid scaffolding protein n=1 Tax=Citrobacter portucalensis TaxID=1639133 RepID=A0AAW7LQ60_9ENTR|nr:MULTISPECIES: GPO family capsid scaffolding protein [Citrobacter]EKW2050508.1 GPO family capsid scaffolding protein [Citrobacter freundii]MBJ8930393.1 GPO family capsid scaffolding protein [Citrobacter freundii]MBY5297205.1 phage capsid protein [Citrobacter freundii]MDM2902506.1 GPO family capsid scaffolding protein [Citrobacter sp. Cpo037]MDN4368701.1 GPO family capsid scaffolding protein [Citrobacter portucalensis]